MLYKRMLHRRMRYKRMLHRRMRYKRMLYTVKCSLSLSWSLTPAQWFDAASGLGSTPVNKKM